MDLLHLEISYAAIRDGFTFQKKLVSCSHVDKIGHRE